MESWPLVLQHGRGSALRDELCQHDVGIALRSSAGRLKRNLGRGALLLPAAQPRSFGVLTPRCFPSRWVKGVGGQGCVCCH